MCDCFSEKRELDLTEKMGGGHLAEGGLGSYTKHLHFRMPNKCLDIILSQKQNEVFSLCTIMEDLTQTPVPAHNID